MIPSHARTRADRTLTDAATVTRVGTDTFDADSGEIEAGVRTAVWSGYCSLSPPSSSDRTLTVGDDRLLGSLIARLPVCSTSCATTSGDPDDIAVGDRLTVDGIAYVVKVNHTRTTEVLRRLVVIEANDAAAVPR